MDEARQLPVPPSGEMRWLRVGNYLIVLARGNWAREDDAFTRVLEEAGFAGIELNSEQWAYTFDEQQDMDMWVLRVMGEVAHV